MSLIAKVEIARIDYPTVGGFKFFPPDRSGQSVRPTIVIRITDSDGRTGYGQAVPIPTWADETPESAEIALRCYLAPAVIGRDPGDLAEVHRAMHGAIRPAMGIGQPLAKAAIDVACWDLLARSNHVSVAQKMGEVRQSHLTLSWTIAAGTLADVELQLEQGRARGYRNFNIKLGYPQTPAYDLELAKCVKAFEPDGFLWADANTAYETGDALAALPRLADAGVAVMESPLPPVQFSGYQRLKKQGALPVLMDEGLTTADLLEEFIALRMLDGVALKPARNAGLWQTRRMVDMLRDRGMMVLGSGLTDPDISLAASVHAYCFAGIQYPCALNGPQFLQTMHATGLRIQADRIELPDGPGLGIELPPCIIDQLQVAAQA